MTRKILMGVCLAGILLISGPAFSQNNPAKNNSKPKKYEWLQPGISIIYLVNNDYDFVVNLMEMKGSILFNYSMKNGGVKGSVKITSTAMGNAVAMNNYFKGGDEVLKDKTAVWMSKKVYNAIKSDSTIAIIPRYTEEMLQLVGMETMEIYVNDQKQVVDVLHAKTNEGSEFWILDNPKSPLILRMILDFEIVISEIKTIL